MPEAEQKSSQTDAKQRDSRNGEAPHQPDEDPVGRVYDSRLIKRLGRYLRPYWWQATVASISISLKSLSDVAGPYLVMVGIDRYFPSGNERAVPSAMLVHEGGPTALLLRHLPTDPVQGIPRLA